MEKIIEKGLAVAKEAKQRAYAPYSHFQVGAAVITDKNEIFPGCNIENASFGGTVCAERNAIFHMISRCGVQKIKAIVLITDPIAVPCGMCLQVMSEFASEDFKIHAYGPNSEYSVRTLNDFLPYRFDPKSLKK